MSVLANYLMMTFQDTKGRHITMLLTTQDQSELDTSPYDSLISAAQAVTDCGLIAVQFVKTKHYSNVGVVGPYSSDRDRARLQARCADQTPKWVDIPGPKEGIFDTTHQRVVMSNPDIASLVAALEGVIGNASGSPVVAVERGNRQLINPTPGV